MDGHDLIAIAEAHARLQDTLKSIQTYRSEDKNIVFRDRAERTLWALMDYLASTPLPVDGAIHTIHTLILALQDVDNGQHNPLFKPASGRGGRPVNASVHHRRAVIFAAVKHLTSAEIAKDDTAALKQLSKLSGVRLGSLESDLNKAIHEPNPDIIDPKTYSIPPDYDLPSLAEYIKRLFSPKP